MEPASRSVAALLAYDGTEFHGFQVQVGVPTIQGTLEAALATVAKATSRVSGAGRTDAGVHASGQVVGVEVVWRHPLPKLQDAWNARLPRSLLLRELVEAPAGFHPRFSALSRTYRYTVVQGDGRRLNRSPLTDRYAWFVPRGLDVAAMQTATRELIGEHDFAGFGQPTQGESTVRQVLTAAWGVETGYTSPVDGFPGDTLVLTITANGFLRQMVRSIVGTLVAIGRGELDAAAMRTILAARQRSMAAPPAPPQGLVFAQVTYPTSLALWQSALG